MNDNSNTLSEAGIASFSLTVENTNGTIYLNINNRNYSASKTEGNIYSVNVNLNPGTYTYSWYSYDSFGKFIYESIKKSYVFGEAVSETSSGGSSGISSGGPSSILPKIVLSESEVGSSSLVTLPYNQEIDFSIDEEDYSISLKSINREDNLVFVKIDSIEEEISLKRGEIKDIDLNGDVVSDIELELIEISPDSVEANIEMKRKVILRTDVGGTEIKPKSIINTNPIKDVSIQTQSIDPLSSRLFGWLGDLFDSNKRKCNSLNGHIWSKSLDFCINEDVSPTYNNKIILNYLSDNFNFGKSFVQIEEIIIYDCEGCFYINMVVDGEIKEYYFQDWKEVDQICMPSVSCSDINIQCGEIDDGCGRTLDCGDCSSSEFCADNRCIPEIIPLSCHDSDDGENYFIKGEATDRWGTEKDRCQGNILIEAFCEGISTNVKSYECPSGCLDGACLEWAGGCTDSDGGNWYFYNYGEVIDKEGIRRIDYCESSENIIEGLCSSVNEGEYSYVRYACPNGCNNGTCNEGPANFYCSDWDGNNPNISGVLMDKATFVAKDICLDNYTLQEFYCSGDNITSQIYNCEFGCGNGACLGDPTPLVCSDSDGGINDSIKGIINDSEDVYEDYCKDFYNLVEGYCEPVSNGELYGSQTIYCPFGCENGACKEGEINCIDDDGLDFYYEGHLDFRFTDGEMKIREDRCSNTTDFIGWSQDDWIGIYTYDFYCDPYMANFFPYHGGKMYECPEGCLAGKCIVPKNETSYCDDSGYCKLYEGEYLLFDEYVVISTNYIYTNEDLAIGSDYNYSEPQKVDLNISIGSAFEINTGEMNEFESFDYDFSSQGFFWMNITILNLFSNYDSSTVYETIATPYVEFIYEIPDYASNTKKRKPSVRTSKTKPVLKSSVSYEPPTIITKIGRGIQDFFGGGDVSLQNIEMKTKPIARKGKTKPVLK